MKYLIKNANLTGLCKYLNQNYKKQGNNLFSPRDVLGYVQRKRLPNYLGGHQIIEIAQENCSVKLYNLVANENE